MSKEQVSISELLLSLDSSELQEAERVRAAVNKQLATDRGGAVLLSLVEYYLDSFSSQAVLLLSSIREPHHKVLLEKLNDSLSRSRTRLAAVTLLGHLIRKQPPWVHHISQSVLLSSLLRCLKSGNAPLTALGRGAGSTVVFQMISACYWTMTNVTYSLQRVSVSVAVRY
uniref:Uncharacterized protein n=1 Tax=Nothobranchius furzeri TaxID=105023 RepID=A0A8C6PJ11_NOTFU